MKTQVFGMVKNVPFRDLAHIFGFLCLFFSVWAMTFSQKAHAAEDTEQMERLYRQYMDEPSEDLYNRGNELLQKGDMDGAMVCFTIVGNRYTPKMSKDEKRICAYALNNAGGIAQMRFSFSSAFGYFQKAMQVADEPIYQSYNNIAGIYLFFNDYVSAKKYLNEAFNISLEQKDWNSLANSCQNIMYLNWCLDSIGESKSCIERFLQTKGIPRDSLFLAVEVIAQGMTALMNGQNQRAIDYFKTYIDHQKAGLAVKNEDVNSAHLYLAYTYMRMRDYKNAIHYLNHAESEARRNGITDLLIKIYQYEEKCYRLMGDKELEHQAKYQLMSLKDSINTSEEFGKIKNIEFFHEVDKFEKQVVKLNEEKNARSIVAMISVIALVAVVLFLIFAVRQNRKLWSSNKDLYRKNDELVKQADLERDLRTTYTKRAKAYEQEIESLQQSILQLQDPSPATPPLTPPLRGAGNNGGVSTQHPSVISDELRTSLVERIYQQLDDVDFICQQDLTIERLAQAVDSNEKYVSQVINESMNKNFNTLLNEYRIREICKRLTDFAHYGNMTNETIAEGVGFKSRSHFIRTFKKVTGLTPSQYQKIAKSEGVYHLQS